MKFNASHIFLGIFILFALSYLLITVFSFVYLKFVAKAYPKNPGWWLKLSNVALAWVVTTLLVFLVTSVFGLFVFATLSLFTVFGIGYFYTTSLLALDGKHKIIYSLILAILINPAWLFALIQL